MTDDLYYRKMESTSTTDLVDMIRERDGRIAKLEQENAELKRHNKAVGTTLELHSKLMKSKLTNAKESILKLSTCLEGHSNNKFEYELLQEAEQFLKELNK